MKASDAREGMASLPLAKREKARLEKTMRDSNPRLINGKTWRLRR
ncbi:hypothetical protein CsSME_00047121 [Camellia sinensis var. sinensis]